MRKPFLTALPLVVLTGFCLHYVLKAQEASPTAQLAREFLGYVLANDANSVGNIAKEGLPPDELKELVAHLHQQLAPSSMQAAATADANGTATVLVRPVYDDLPVVCVRQRRMESGCAGHGD